MTIPPVGCTRRPSAGLDTGGLIAQRDPPEIQSGPLREAESGPRPRPRPGRDRRAKAAPKCSPAQSRLRRSIDRPGALLRDTCVALRPPGQHPPQVSESSSAPALLAANSAKAGAQLLLAPEESHTPPSPRTLLISPRAEDAAGQNSPRRLYNIHPNLTVRHAPHFLRTKSTRKERERRPP